jgi:hypothetical protein
LPIRGYQRLISPALGRNCRFTPTCSAYAIQAIETHGCIKGTLLAAARIARCHPWGKWGFDPVPEPGKWTNPRRILHSGRSGKKTHHFSTETQNHVENKDDPNASPKL